MSRSSRTRQPAAGSRRTRRAEQQPEPSLAELADDSPKIVSNPIFRCEAAGPSQPKPPPAADHLVGCVYRPGSLYALVHDPAAADAATGGIGTGKPLPLPPCRAHRAGPGAGSHVPASRSGPALAGAGGPHGRALRSSGGAPQDPFLAAYVACSKSAAGGEDAAGADQHQQKQKQGKAKKKKRAAKKRGKEGEEIARGGCGILSGWAAGAKYAGAMSSCRYGCAVAEPQQGQGDATATAAAKVAGQEQDAAAGPTLDLSWAPAVLSARALERRRQQR